MAVLGVGGEVGAGSLDAAFSRSFKISSPSLDAAGEEHDCGVGTGVRIPNLAAVEDRIRAGEEARALVVATCNSMRAKRAEIRASSAAVVATGGLHG